MTPEAGYLWTRTARYLANICEKQVGIAMADAGCGFKPEGIACHAAPRGCY